MDIDAYLARIDYSGDRSPTIDTLKRLHAAHLLTVPFENLSIHWGEPIVLSDEALYDKIVVRRRGGFCYELNGLFAWLLRGLGFDVKMVSAEVFNKNGTFSPPFDHMALIATLHQRWLVDVGFGKSFRQPLRLDNEAVQSQPCGNFKIIGSAENYQLHAQQPDKKWAPQFQFTTQPYAYADFAAMCHFHQTSPQSHFTQKHICSRATPSGRITISDTRLIHTPFDGTRTETKLADKAAYRSALRHHFGIAAT